MVQVVATPEPIFGFPVKFKTGNRTFVCSEEKREEFMYSLMALWN